MSGESNGAWGSLAVLDDDLAAQWDGFERLPDPGENDALDAFLASKDLTIGSLVRLGAKLSAPTVIAYPFDGGIKFRSLETGKRWNATGSVFDTLKIVRAGREPSNAVLVAESETDAAKLGLLYPHADIAVMPAGAKCWTATFADQLKGYEAVYLCLDADAAGDAGAAKIAASLPHAVRHAPPDGLKDWCEYRADAAPPLPEAVPPVLGLRTRGVDLARVLRTAWTWTGRLPDGYLALLIGEEGIGKGTFVAWLAAQVTRGELDGDHNGRAARVLIVGDEDAFESVWVPRLAAAGADLALVQTLAEGEHLADLAASADDLLAAIEREDFGLIVFDQLLDHIDGGSEGGGIYNAKHVRQSLAPLRRVARQAGVAVLALLHPPKGRPGDFRSLVAGSHQLTHCRAQACCSPPIRKTTRAACSSAARET